MRSNILAVLVFFAGITVLYANFDPTTVGADAEELRVGQAAISVNEPLPVFDADLTEDQIVDISDTTNATTEAVVEDAATEVKTASTESPVQADQPRGLKGRYALLMNVMMLEKGINFLSEVHSYTATFNKVERVSGEVMEQRIQLKVRQAPYSVYMKWFTGDKGRELLYVDGANEGKMLIKLGGLKGRFLPTLRLDPLGSRAMAEARHPVTKAGLQQVAEELLKYRTKDLTQTDGVQCQMLEEQPFDGRQCFCFMIQYKDKSFCSEYRRSIVYLDKERMIPLQVCNYEWADNAADLSPEELAEATLCEDYRYTNLKLGLQFADAEFQKGHSDYGFK